MKFKRTFAILIVLLYMVSCMPVLANASSNVADIRGLDMEQYFTLTESGTIHFDMQAAKDAGIGEDIIAAVDSQIAYMNQLVSSGKAYITNNFVAVQNTSLVRASGVNKVETYWYGLTEIYMDSEKADAFYNKLLMQGDNLSNYTYEQILEGAGVEGAAGILMAGYFYNYVYQVGVAKESGRGIIMSIQTDLVNGGQTIWFSSQ